MDKLAYLGGAAVFDVTCADEKREPAQLSSLTGLAADGWRQRPGFPAVTHVNSCGRQVPILKVLLTSHCEMNCRYCAFRRDIDRPRESLEPAELAKVTIEMARTGLIEGIFLSSGIGRNVQETMSRIVDTGRILRERYGFPGYVHLKILPGSSLDLIEAAGRYADRISINMEAPTEAVLRDIAPGKSLESNIFKRMRWIETLRREGRIPRHVGQVTQFVVGASDDPGASDRALVTVAHYLYKTLNFRRIYYSAFHPVPDTPLENRPAEDPRRVHRLYQADQLVAKYGFQPEELIFDEAGRLDTGSDPKETWARAHPEMFPVELTRADPSLLMRVPGIGPTLCRRILRARSEGRLRSVEDYLRLGHVPRRSLGYVLVNGRMSLPRDSNDPTSLQLSIFR